MEYDTMKYSHRNGETRKPTIIDQYYWVLGEAIIREKFWPYEHRQRVVLTTEKIPIYIDALGFDMGHDIWIPLEWATAKMQFWGPVILIPPWKDK